MAWQWGRSFTSSSYSYSPPQLNSDIEDYIDSDDEPARNTFAHRQPVKLPKAEKSVKNHGQKQVKTKVQKATSRDDYIEKVEFFGCKICNKQYNSKGSLNRHFTTAHGLEKDVKEAKKQKPANAVSKALNTWSPSPRFRCNQCGKELTSQGFLDRHMATHDRSTKPKVKPTKKVSSTNVNVNVFNTVNYGCSASSDFYSVANRFWN